MIKWNKTLELGIPPIDKQHQRIVQYINALDEIKAHPESTHRKVGEILDQLVDYTLSHFAFEEELMEESGYVFVKAHKRVHALFVRKVTSYVDRFRMGEDITDELLISLKTWLINHIKNDDNDYGETVREKMSAGLKPQKGWFRKIFG